MSSPCNNINVVPIKVSQLVRYQNVDVTDYFLTIESGSALYSRKTTFGDLINAFGDVTGSYTGSFSGSLTGKSSGSFSGSYFGKVISKNTQATGSFKGTNSNLSGSFSGSFTGQMISKNAKTSGSFYGTIVSVNTKATGSFNGTFVGDDSKLSGSFSGSHYGQIISKNTKATGSFNGGFRGVDAKLSGSFSGSHYGKLVSKNSLLTGSFRGIDNILNFKGTGKKVSFNGTSSYSVSSSYADSANSVAGGLSGLGIVYTSTNTLQSFLTGTNEGGVGTYCYAVTHGFGSTPSIIKATLICTAIDGLWQVNDEIDVAACYRDTGGDEETPIFATWCNTQYAAVSIGNAYFGGTAIVYVIQRTGAGSGGFALNSNKWNIKIRAWK